MVRRQPPFMPGGYGVDTRIVRIFNTYGPFMSRKDQRVIPQMLTRALRNLPLTMYGDGTQTRSFLYVRDLIDGFARVMKQHGKGEVYNIGGETEITIAELTAEMLRITGSRSEVEHKPHFIPDHDRRLPDTRRIRSLGWVPKTSLATGLQLCIDHTTEVVLVFCGAAGRTETGRRRGRITLSRHDYCFCLL